MRRNKASPDHLSFHLFHGTVGVLYSEEHGRDAVQQAAEAVDGIAAQVGFHGDFFHQFRQAADGRMRLAEQGLQVVYLVFF